MNKFLKIINLIFFIYINSIQANEHNLISARNGDFNYAQEQIIKQIILEDLTVFAFGGGSLHSDNSPLYLDNNVKMVTANKIFADYNNNEVKGDLLYRNKELIIKGKISSIDRSLGDNYYISFKTDNDYATVHAHFEKEFIEELASLKKGQTYSVHCIGNGFLLGSPILGKCQPAKNWIVSKANKETIDIIKDIKQMVLLESRTEIEDKYSKDRLGYLVFLYFLVLNSSMDDNLIKEFGESTDGYYNEKLLRKLDLLSITIKKFFDTIKTTDNLKTGSFIQLGDKFIEYLKEEQKNSMKKNSKKSLK